MNLGGWLSREAYGEQTQVIPINDLRPHVVDGPCWCNPTNDDGVLVHHSMDRREEFEEGRKAS